MRSYIYFAGESLACLRDTRQLAIDHGLIWRVPTPGLPDFDPETHLLLAFWRGPLVSGGFFPLARFETRCSPPQHLHHGQCYCRIPSSIRPAFLQASPGRGGHGYRQKDNPDYMGICVELLDGLDAFWGKVSKDSEYGEDCGGRQCYGYRRGPTGRKAYWVFDQHRLQAPRLPQNMWP